MTTKTPDSLFFEADRSQVHPEADEGNQDRIAADAAWFRAHPKALCYFRPFEAVDLAVCQTYGSNLPYLCDPEHAPRGYHRQERAAGFQTS